MLRKNVLFVLLALIFSAHEAGAQTISPANDSLSELSRSVHSLSALKISGFIQPQWQIQDVDSLGNMGLTRSVFSIRRGRIKFLHRSGDFDFSLMPEITEAGITLKEVFTDWFITDDLTLTAGASNRPFGYEIGFSTPALEFPERSLAEARLFNGEQDLGIKIGYRLSISGVKALVEVGIFNGSDNFGFGAISGIPGVSNKLGFTLLLSVLRRHTSLSKVCLTQFFAQK